MNANESKIQVARQRVAELRRFYTHLIVFVLVMLLLFVIDMLTSPGVLWFQWPLLGWGLAVLIHGFAVFSRRQFFGADWEAKKIDEIMAEEGDR